MSNHPLVLLRQQHVLTQQQLAERAGVSRRTIARIEADDCMPFATTIRKIAHGLGLRPSAAMQLAQQLAQSYRNQQVVR